MSERMTTAMSGLDESAVHCYCVVCQREALSSEATGMTLAKRNPILCERYSAATTFANVMLRDENRTTLRHFVAHEECLLFNLVYINAKPIVSARRDVVAWPLSTASLNCSEERMGMQHCLRISIILALMSALTLLGSVVAK